MAEIEIPRTYKPNTRDSLDYVNLNNIALQPVMLKELKMLNPQIELTHFNVDNTTKTVGERLERTASMKDAFEKKISLEPVVLKLIREGKPATKIIPWTPKGKIPVEKIIPAVPPLYKIVNGRHRVVFSILYGMTHVPAIIQK